MTTTHLPTCRMLTLSTAGPQTWSCGGTESTCGQPGAEVVEEGECKYCGIDLPEMLQCPLHSAIPCMKRRIASLMTEAPASEATPQSGPQREQMARIIYERGFPNYDDQDKFMPWDAIHEGSVEKYACRRAADALIAAGFGAGQAESWRCFHCDEVLTDKNEAAEHFGIQIDGLAEEVACKLSEDQKALISMLREQQRELDKYHTEDNASYREFYALGAEHSTKLREAEQQGYDKGLADGRTLAAKPEGGE